MASWSARIIAGSKAILITFNSCAFPVCLRGILNTIKNGEFLANITQEVRFSSYLELESADMNRIVLAAIGNEFKVWINDNYEGRYYDDSSEHAEGGLAFYCRAGCREDHLFIS